MAAHHGGAFRQEDERAVDGARSKSRLTYYINIRYATKYVSR